ncbi:MAG: alpha/beta hydrolase [Candidatus Omnitrophota bacterium]
MITQIRIIFYRILSIAPVVAVLFFTACAAPSLNNKNIAVERIVKDNNFGKACLETKDFTLMAYYRFREPQQPINIYIEGDGSAWRNCARLSEDPTPRNPLVLELAAIDSSPNVAYLSRPGQYPMSCGASKPESSYWSGKRFSKEVITSVNEAINQLAYLAGSDKINLIGYSGGAAIAVLAAAQRKDVVSLRTIAGNLDSDAVNKHHNVSILSGSLNPIDVAQELKKIPQRHFVGANDKVVPGFIAESFVKRMDDKDFKRITVVKSATHTKGWQEHWKELLGYPVE